MIKIKCKKCKKIFNRWPYEIKKYKSIENYICLLCIRSQKTKNNCKVCNKEFQYNIKENRKFCSKSCSAIFNNKNREKSSYISNKLKKSKCFTCGYELMVNIRCSINNTKCKDCKRKNRNKNTNNCRKIHNTEFICKICGNKFLHHKYSTKKTCSDKCKNIASVGIRTYQNGSRKTTWYFNKNQNKEVLLESSWEVKVAEKLDEYELKWIRPEPIIWYDNKNKKRYYYPDFYLPNFDLYLDPKNPYCMKLDKNKIDFISKSVKLVYGDINKILNHIENIHSTVG